jgi:DNA-binding Xre family transcriptional regulator
MSYGFFVALKRVLDVENITQMSKVLGWDVTSLNRMQSGKRRVSGRFVLRVCEYLDCSPKDLFEKTGMPDKED